MHNEELKKYTKNLSVLFVEDDQVSNAIMGGMLKPYFTTMYSAYNGLEALTVFSEKQPDLVITDLMMPKMDGISMLHEIRKIDNKIPVILVTASLEHIYLVEAINLGVSKFLAKPITRDALHGVLLSVAKELAVERLMEESRQQEVELLRLRNLYHARQEELAKRKEHHIARNWLNGHYISAPKHGSWIVDVVHHPKDVMSGDSFSIKNSNDGRLIVFLADAMGHGLSAAVSSMLATSFFNHATNGCSCAPLAFKELILRTIHYVSRNLLDDEVFSCSFLQIDINTQIAALASYGMPPVRLIRNGIVEIQKGANPPVSSFQDGVVLQEFSLAGVSDILMATDGLRDALMPGDQPYFEALPDDLLASSTATELFTLFQQRDCQEDDDITIIRLTNNAETDTNRRQCFESPATPTGIADLQQQLNLFLNKADVSGDKRFQLELAVTEALQNAFEHGCLKLGERKQELLLHDEYDNLIQQVGENTSQKIELHCTITPKTGGQQILIEIIDPGDGFSIETGDESDVYALCRRGLTLIKRSVDRAVFTAKGNSIMLLQTVPDDIV